MYNDSMEGAVLGGRYQLQERIGVGGMSVVYRAMDTQTDCVVAIKMLKAEYCSDLEFVRRFQNEIRATAGLQHPNIVKIYDQGEESGMPYIVMEFIEGITLKDYIVALQTVKWRDALNVTAQVLSAVGCAHEHKVIHRDIKPQNIMITDSGQIKLTDFGIARVVSSSTKQAKPDSAGSVHYLSPEQARGGFVDERSDIYSIGIMLYEMVTGVVPFDGESHVSIALKHIDGHIVPPHTVDPEIPYGVSDLIMMATNKNPLQRFQSAEEMYDRMQKVIEAPGFSFLGGVMSFEEEEEAEMDFLSDNEADGGKKAVSYRAERTEIIRSVTVSAVAYTLAFIVGILGIVFILSRFQNLKKNMNAFSDVQYQIADYTGLQADAVARSLTEKGLQVQKIPVESDAYPVGYVVGQNFEEGTIVESRAVIELEVSSLNGSFVLEDYAGSDYRDVGAKLGSLGIKVTYAPIASGKYKEQKVVRTSPDAGSIIVAGDSVVIYYSSGTLFEKVSVPNLSGLTLEAAQKKLEQVGLRLGTVYPEPGSDITDLVSGIPEFAALSATLSASPSLDTSPAPTPSPKPESVFASETVVEQYPTAGTKVYTYETINLYFCETRYLEGSKEMTFDYPQELDQDACDVRIDYATVGSGLATTLYNERNVEREDFPLTVPVPFSYNGAPTRVTIYIDGEVYQEIVMYE